ncbi:MAG: DsbA family oxidoreductase [Thermomicrobiales bacterium]
MTALTRIEMYADLSCPFAYVTHARWRQLRPEYAGRAEIIHKCLALEYVNREPTPKPTIEVELPILLLGEPEIPYAPWRAAASEWPVTFWPAFEAVKCAERQGLAAADDLAWAIRVAFFAEHRCVSMRHVLLDLAERVGLDQERFTRDFDSGVAKGSVIEEARDGWERLKAPGSPTWALPSGVMVSELGLPELDLDQGGRPIQHAPAPCSGGACLDRLRRVLDEALGVRR